MRYPAHAAITSFIAFVILYLVSDISGKSRGVDYNNTKALDIVSELVAIGFTALADPPLSCIVIDSMLP